MERKKHRLITLKYKVLTLNFELAVFCDFATFQRVQEVLVREILIPINKAHKLVKVNNQLYKSICSREATFAIELTSGQLWSWGQAWNGQLGHGDFEYNRKPELVQALKEKMEIFGNFLSPYKFLKLQN